MADNPYEPDRPEDDRARPPASPDAAPEEQTTDLPTYPSPDPAADQPVPERPADPARADEARPDGEPAAADEPLTAEQPLPAHEPVAAGSPAATDETAPAHATPDESPTVRVPADGASPSAAASPGSGPYASSPETTRTTQVAGPGAVSSTFDLRERSAEPGHVAGTSEADRSAGAHEADRPVPRSGLAEHYSAGYLTGELSPREREAAASPAQTTGAGDRPAGPVGAPAQTEVVESTAPPTAEEDPVLAGATAVGKPPSRAGAHVWGLLITLLLTPVAWYLLADAGARLTLPGGNPWDTTNLNIAALLELAGGLLVLVVVLLAARWSSVGAIVTGSLVLVVGVPFVAVPGWTQNLLESVTDWLAGLGDFGDNITHHLVATGSTGRFVVYGVALILIGVISHGARRQGRREMRPAPAAAD